jgi:hypothetical protein
MLSYFGPQVGADEVATALNAQGAAIVSSNLMRSLRFALLRVKLRGWPVASMTRGRFSPLILCLPEYPTSVFAPFETSQHWRHGNSS